MYDKAFAGLSLSGKKLVECSKNPANDCSELEKKMTKEYNNCLTRQKMADEGVVKLISHYDDQLLKEEDERLSGQGVGFSRELINLKKKIIKDTLQQVDNKVEFYSKNRDLYSSLFFNCIEKNASVNNIKECDSVQNEYQKNAKEHDYWLTISQNNRKNLGSPTISTLDANMRQNLLFPEQKKIYEPLYNLDINKGPRM